MYNNGLTIACGLNSVRVKYQTIVSKTSTYCIFVNYRDFCRYNKICTSHSIIYYLYQSYRYNYVLLRIYSYIFLVSKCF